MKKIAFALVLGAAAPVISNAALAQGYPAKPLRVIAPFPAGGSLDVIARLLAQPMSGSLGKPVVVENRPGGTGVIGVELVARAPADGHTLLVMGSAFAIHAAVRPRLPYDAMKDFTGVARIASNPLLVSVHPSLPVNTMRDLVKLAAARPAQLTYATSGLASPQHLAMEAFRMMAHIDLVHVPYQGGAPATTAVLGGHTSISVANLSETSSYVAAGKLRALAVTSLSRSELLKDVPTIAESGFPRFDLVNWFGAWLPASSPKEAVARLGGEIGRAVALAEVKTGLRNVGLSPAFTGPAEFDAFFRAEARRYAKIAGDLAITID